jgi:RNA polymerase sigma factor (sigma-70 family)
MSANEHAFQQTLHSLYSDHRSWLQNWLRRKLGCRDQAADMMQETFCRLLSLSREDLAALQTPRAYLTTTATRLMIDQARRQKVEQAYLETLALTHAEHYVISPEQQLEIIETLTLIAGMLESMADKPRQAFMLSRLENFTYPEISAVLGVSVSMVKQYIAKAMVHCHQIVYGEGA